MKEIKLKKNNKSNPASKISGKNTRGYRLKPETHDLIVKIQNMLGSDQDKAIAAACGMLITELSAGEKKHPQKNNSDPT